MGDIRPLTSEGRILANRLVSTAMRLVVLTLLITGATSTPSRADNGLVSAVVTKGGFVVGAGGGRGTLISTATAIR
jgi:hypothetical protein